MLSFPSGPRTYAFAQYPWDAPASYSSRLGLWLVTWTIRSEGLPCVHLTTAHTHTTHFTQISVSHTFPLYPRIHTWSFSLHLLCIFFQVIEPSAGVGVSVVLSETFKKYLKENAPGVKRVGVIICGGNVDLDALPWVKH